MKMENNQKIGNKSFFLTINAVVDDHNEVALRRSLTLRTVRWKVENVLTESTVVFSVARRDSVVLNKSRTRYIATTFRRVVGRIPLFAEGE